MKIGSAHPLLAFPIRRCVIYLAAAALLLDQFLGAAHAAAPFARACLAS